MRGLIIGMVLVAIASSLPSSDFRHGRCDSDLTATWPNEVDDNSLLWAPNENSAGPKFRIFSEVDVRTVEPETDYKFNLKQLDEETKMARFLITIEEEVSDEQSSLSDEQCQNDPGMLKSLTDESEHLSYKCYRYLVERSGNLGDFYSGVPFEWRSPSCGCIEISAEVLDEQNRIYTKEDDRFLALKLRACVKSKKADEKVDKRMETPIENEKIEKSNESENIDSENTEEDDEEKAKTIEHVENVEMVENVEKVENVENVEKAENVEKSENVDDVKSKKVEVEEKFEKEESKKSELKNDGDEEVHDEADDIMNKIKEWYQEDDDLLLADGDGEDEDEVLPAPDAFVGSEATAEVEKELDGKQKLKSLKNEAKKKERKARRKARKENRKRRGKKLCCKKGVSAKLASQQQDSETEVSNSDVCEQVPKTTMNKAIYNFGLKSRVCSKVFKLCCEDEIRGEKKIKKYRKKGKESKKNRKDKKKNLEGKDEAEEEISNNEMSP